MSNNQNFSAEQLDVLFKAAAKSTGTDPQKLKKAVEEGNMDGVLGSMRPSDSAKLKQILGNKAATEKLLSTPQAQQLLKKIMNKGK